MGTRFLTPYSALLFLSGAAGLAYEVCWSRILGSFLGRGERGQALTLVLFFVGMALGYALSARRSTRAARPLQGYALCEALIGAFALALPWISARLGPTEGMALWLTLLPATVAMGASLPFALEQVARARNPIAPVYGWHLLGATLGSLFTTFYAIEALGVFASTFAAAGFSLTSALWSFFLARASDARPRIESDHEANARPSLRLAAAAALAGATTLALEVLVLRLFALTFHNSTYTFGLTIGVFIVYLAVGSYLCGRSRRAPERVAASGAALAAVGVCLVVHSSRTSQGMASCARRALQATCCLLPASCASCSPCP